MSIYTERLKDGFNVISGADTAEMDDLLAVYDDSYICVSEAFEACRSDIYIDRTKTPGAADVDFLKAFDADVLGKKPEEIFPEIFATSEEGAPVHVRDYFETIQVLCENDPEGYFFEGDDLDFLRDAFKESLLLAQKHLHENFAFRPISADVQNLYYDTAEALDRTLEAL